MKKFTSGIHHISAIVGDPQENVDFYAGILGLRLVKKTVNFDDPGTYHLYFGDGGGRPGTIMTFFPWPGANRGVIGDGQVGVIAFAVPAGALGFWEDRLTGFGIAVRHENRFGEESIRFDDPHGLQLEIVERAEGVPNEWLHDGIPQEAAIKGFGGATLFSADFRETARLLENGLGFKKAGEEGGYIRFISSGDIGNVIDLKAGTSGNARIGAGTVHHIAWRATDDRDQEEWQELIAASGYAVTPVKDRNYFNAVYFREHGRILFEIATDPPGFAIDEAYGDLGGNLMLPPQFSPYREQIERRLIPIKVRNVQPGSAE